MKKYALLSGLVIGVILLGSTAALANDETVVSIDAPIAEIVVHPYEAEFFSIERNNPYSEEDLEHEPSNKDSLPWPARTSGCISLPTYAEYEDCMWRPWRYGF